MVTFRLFKSGRGIATMTALSVLIERHHKEKA